MSKHREYADLFKDMIEKIQEKIELKALILFGSRGRGENTEFSDYDIFIIGNFSENYFQRVRNVLDFTPDVSVDVFCYTSEEFDEMFNSYKLIAIDAIGEGIVLFGEEFIRPYMEKHADFIRRGMKKLTCTLIPPLN